MNGREALIKASWLVWRNHPAARHSGVEAVKSWVTWLMSESFLLFVMDDEVSKNIVGMVIIRPMMDIEDRYDFYTFDQEGPILFIDLVVSKHPEALAALGFAALDRYGMRETVAWERGTHEVVTCPCTKFRRVVLRRALIRN